MEGKNYYISWIDFQPGNVFKRWWNLLQASLVKVGLGKVKLLLVVDLLSYILDVLACEKLSKIQEGTYKAEFQGLFNLPWMISSYDPQKIDPFYVDSD